MSILNQRLNDEANAISDRFDNVDASIGVSALTHGAVADCTDVGVGTDNHTAFQAAIDALGDRGGTLRLPKGFYRLSQTLVFNKNVRIIGEGWTQNPGTVGVTNYPAPTYYYGTVLVFDANTAGIQFLAFTDNQADSTAYEFQSAYNSGLKDIMLYGGGGTSSTAHGVETRTLVQFDNVRIQNFSGDGFRMLAYTAGVHPYGNANLSILTRVDSAANSGHGFYIEGIDSNACTFIGCNAIGNGGVGFLDKSLLGNFYMGCHTNNNNLTFGTSSTTRTRVETDASMLASTSNNGSYVTINGGGAENVFLGCYTEIGGGSLAEISGNAQIFGGTLSEVGSNTASSRGSYKFQGDLTLNKPSDPTIDMVGISGVFAEIKMRGDGNIAHGLDILAGGSAGYLSADSLVVRNAAQNVTYGTFDSAGLNLGSGKVLKVNATQVVGPRVTGWTAATNTKSKATFDTTAVTLPNLAARVGQLIDDLIAHGIIGA